MGPGVATDALGLAYTHLARARDIVYRVAYMSAPMIAMSRVLAAPYAPYAITVQRACALEARLLRMDDLVDALVDMPMREASASSKCLELCEEIDAVWNDVREACDECRAVADVLGVCVYTRVGMLMYAVVAYGTRETPPHATMRICVPPGGALHPETMGFRHVEFVECVGALTYAAVEAAYERCARVYYEGAYRSPLQMLADVSAAFSAQPTKLGSLSEPERVRARKKRRASFDPVEHATPIPNRHAPS